MTIIVDTREHFIPQIKDLLVTSILGENIPEFRFACLGKDGGDYLLENEGHTALIERKSISDFVGSYRDLKPRLAFMRLMGYERTGLLLEGTYTVAQGMVWLYESNELKARMSYKTMSNFLTHQQELGTKLYHTMNLEETIWRLIYIHNYLPRLSVPIPVIKCGSPAELLVQLPGIGQSTIKKMQETYKTPLDAINGLKGKARQSLESW